MSMTSESGWAICTPTAAGRPVAHGAQAARGHPAVGARRSGRNSLRRPHLVLADLGGDVDGRGRGSAHRAAGSRTCGLDQLRVGGIGEALAGAPSVDLLPTSPPGRPCRSSDCAASTRRSGSFRTEPAIADDADVGAHVLCRSSWRRCRCGSGASRARRRPAAPVTRSSKRAPIATMTSQVVHGVCWPRSCRACPACPATADRTAGNAPQTHQRRGHRRAGQRGELTQQGGGPAAPR